MQCDEYYVVPPADREQIWAGLSWVFQLADDLRDPASVASLSPDLLFRRVHSRKKIFLLSKKLACLVNACYRTAGALTSCRHKSSRAREKPGEEVSIQSDSRTSELRRQVQGLLRSKIKWMHAGATVLIKHSESEAGEEKEFGARGWRVAQVGCPLGATQSV